MDLWGILWLFVLLIGNGFFVGAEFAIMTARRSQIEPRAEAGSRFARTTLWAMEHATLILATTQLGVTVCSLLILLVSEPAIHHLLAVPLEALHVPEGVVDGVALAITIALVSFLHVVLGEALPKNFSIAMPDRAALLLATPLVGLATVLRPVIWLLNVAARGILRIVGVRPRDEAVSAFTIDEVQTIVRTSTREGVLADTTGALGAAFEFTEKTANDVALGLPALVTLGEDATPAQVEAAVREHGFSRYVLVDEEGEPTGYLHLKDVLDISDDEDDDPVPPKRIRQLVSIFRGTELEDALAILRRSGAHLARVFDENGSTTGILFLEDVIEELVGEVEDATRR